MSFFDDASLVFLPSGQAGKDGKAYSMKPTDGSGDFTFSRGSNLTATRVDSNGLIEKGRENLLLQSNQFDTTWTSVSVSLTSGQSGYDGSSDAWLLEADSDGGSRRIRQTTTATGISTLSVYAKAGSVNYIAIYASGSNYGRYFDLNPSTSGNRIGSALVNAPIESKIEEVGNGWFRCSITLDWNTSQAWIYPIATDGSTITTTGDNIYIQDSQLEQGLVATEYIESGASTGKAGILEDSPRFDYSGGASCPSLLLEPSRTNLIPSEYLPLMSIIGSPVITPNATTSPEGYQNMAEFSSSATSDRYQKNLGVLSGQHTFSAFFKYSGTDKSVYLRMSDTSSRLKIDIASSGVTIDSGGSSNIDDSDVIDYGNGIYRAYMVFTPSTGTTFAQFYPSATDTSGSIYAYGFQMEEGSYSSSYIPNHSGGSVTREADSCSGAGDASTFNDDEGVLYVEASALANDGTSRMIALSDASSANHIRIYPTTTDNRITIAIKSGNVNQYVYHYDGLSDITDTWKVAVRYKRNDFATFVNGVKVDSSSSGSVATGLDELQFNGGASANYFYGKSNQVLVFNSYLSDSEIITLTS